MALLRLVMDPFPMTIAYHSTVQKKNKMDKGILILPFARPSAIGVAAHLCGYLAVCRPADSRNAYKTRRPCRLRNLCSNSRLCTSPPTHPHHLWSVYL